jgi:hypothetical protein
MPRGIKLIRYGGLSPKKQEHGCFEGGVYYGPPRRKGIYAFIYPHMDLFFVSWCDRGQQEVIHRGPRTFWYEGPIWTHLSTQKEKQDEIEWVGSWREVHTDYLKELYKRNKHEDTKELMHECRRITIGKYFPKAGQPIIDPYKRGLRGFMSEDHLEVYISGEYCGRIR